MKTISQLINRTGNVKGYANQHKIADTLNVYNKKGHGKYSKSIMEH